MVRSLTSKASWPQFQEKKKGQKRTLNAGPCPHKPPKARRVVNRIPKELEEGVGTRARQNRLTVLETRSVSAEIQHQYQGYFSKFEDFCKLNGVGVPNQSIGCRSTFGRFSRPAVPRWQVSKGRREDRSGLGVSSDRLERASPSFKEGTQRLAKSRPAFQQIANAQTCYVRSSHELARREQNGHGSIGAGGFSPLLAPGRRTGPENVVPPVRQAGNQFQHITVIIRDQPPRQNCCVRQQPATGRQEGRLHGVSLARQSQVSSTSHRSDLQFLHGRLPESLCKSRGGLRACLPPSIPTPAWRCHGGPCLQAPRLSRCEGKRKVENGSECEKVCEDRSHPAVAGSDDFQRQKLLQMERNEHEKDDVGPVGRQEVQVSHAARDLSDKTVPRPHRFALEIFAGSARVSQALCDVGIPTYPIDICLFPSHNVLDPLVHTYIRNLMLSGRVLLIWLGMPCATFSRARRNDGRGPGPLRDLDHVMGLLGLSYNDRLRETLYSSFLWTYYDWPCRC